MFAVATVCTERQAAAQIAAAQCFMQQHLAEPPLSDAQTSNRGTAVLQTSMFVCSQLLQVPLFAAGHDGRLTVMKMH